MEEGAPPHDREAEMAVLGACLLSPLVAEEAISRLTPADFYLPQHEVIFQCIIDAKKDGPVDPITVGHALDVAGETSRVGGYVYLHDLTAVVGIASNAAHHIGIIQQFAHRRKLIHGLQRALGAATDSGCGLDEAVARAGVAINAAVPPEAAGDGLITLDDFLDVDAGEDDWVIPELLTHGDRLVITGVEGYGKALALDTPLPTPDGWTLMGEVAVGDYVYDESGNPTRVVAATDVMIGRPCYRVRFSDGCEIIADAEHQWLTETARSRDVSARALRRSPGVKPRGSDQRHKRRHFPSVVTTEHIASTLRARGGHCANHSIETCGPLQAATTSLPIAPYVLGAWLGDGSSGSASITCHSTDMQIIDNIRSHGYTVTSRDGLHWSITRQDQRRQARLTADRLVESGESRRGALAIVGLDRRGDVRNVEPVLSLSEELRSANLLGNKHIPAKYLRADAPARLALLQGLMDTDGTINTAGLAEFCVTNESLARDVHELVTSLGMKPTLISGPAVLGGRVTGTRWRVAFYPNAQVFHLSRKAERITRRPTRRGELRYIVACDPIESVPVRCIQVEADSHMYLAGKSMIPTHNSLLMRQIGVMVAAGVDPFGLGFIPPKRVLYIDAENPTKIMQRTLGDIVQVARNRHRSTGDRFWMRRHPEGLDLAKAKDRMMLRAYCNKVKPDIMMIGPAYKLYVGGNNDREETLARDVTSALDSLREEFGFALILEHHAPHAQQGAPQRAVRPIGSSLWLRWPEFGFGIRPQKGTRIEDRQADVVHWRGARDDRPWPKELHTGGPASLPWVDKSRILVKPNERRM